MIDISQLPPPDIIDPSDFATIYADKLARFQALYPDYTAALQSDPVTKLLQLSAYDELNMRARINDAARAVLLMYAKGPNLDNLAVLVGVERRLVTPADPTASPPVDAVWETDASVCERVLLAPDGESTAGSVNGYKIHAENASPHVADIAVTTPAPGCISITVLSTDGDGTPAPDLLAQVQAALSPEDVRPLTDNVTVRAADIVHTPIVATLYRANGAVGDIGMAAAQTALDTYLAGQAKLGQGWDRDDIRAALRKPGITRVALSQPADDVACGPTQRLLASPITLTPVVNP